MNSATFPAEIAKLTSEPLIIAALVLLVVVALFRGWWPVLLLVLLVVLGQGLWYLLRHSSLGPEFQRGMVIGVYAFGGVLFLFLAIAHFFTKE